MHFSGAIHGTPKSTLRCVDSQHATLSLGEIPCHTEAVTHLIRVHINSQPCTPSTLSRNERHGWRARLL